MKEKRTTQETPSGIEVTRTVAELPIDNALEAALSRIDGHRGGIFSSGYEYPGRYNRWELAFTDPPVEFVARGRAFYLRALNRRGEALTRMLEPVLAGCAGVRDLARTPFEISGVMEEGPAFFAEEDRSHRPTVLTPLRRLCAALKCGGDAHLGFYGAAGHDLVLQFESLHLRHSRAPDQTDLHLFLPDELVVVDRQKETAHVVRYDFTKGSLATAGHPRETETITAPPCASVPALECDHAPGEFASNVQAVREACFRGDTFEVTLSQTFQCGFDTSPAALFERIRRTNPSPYEFILNLGNEQLVGASPEMFVRVEGRRVETCPIAGTARRPLSLMEEAVVIRDLLDSRKDEAELTMCSDVDRNDKARVCKAGSVHVIGRRQIETYSRLFHTVDHIIGELRDDCDAFDALLSHMWACTLTGAPKPAALQMIEDLERSPREWYGGCIGMFLANGDINTGITIRTVRLKDGLARVRVGATLLADSDPEAEETETRVKASAFLDALLEEDSAAPPGPAPETPSFETGHGRRVLFVDHRDSFVHTLGDYVRRTGAAVKTLRAGFDLEVLEREAPDLVFLSPGPGTPSEFGVDRLVRACVDRGLPVFGVCLGLQGMVEAFGGKLGQLPFPVHGKTSGVECTGEGLFEGFPNRFEVGRYHSLYAIEESIPDCLRVTARSEDGIVMAVEHRTLPVAAVQFHPESILSLREELGMRLIARVVERFAGAGGSLIEPVGIRNVVAPDG